MSKIPIGLLLCEVCGEYKGETIEFGQKVRVECICDGVFCTVCKKNKLHRPISNFYDNSLETIRHVPWTRGFYLVCNECRIKQDAKDFKDWMKKKKWIAAELRIKAEKLDAKKLRLLSQEILTQVMELFSLKSTGLMQKKKRFTLVEKAYNGKLASL